MTYWFQNNGNRVAGERASGFGTPARVRVLDLSNKDKRKLQPGHAWLRLFYDKLEVKALYDAAWGVAHGAGWSKKKEVSFRNMYLDNLPHTLKRVAESLHKQTGWNFSITCGGPLPRAPNGAVNTLHLSVGKCKQGMEWSDWNSEYKEDIQRFRQFCDATFSPAECLALSLNRTPTSTSIASNTTASATAETPTSTSTTTASTTEIAGFDNSMLDPTLLDMKLVSDVSLAFVTDTATSMVDYSTTYPLGTAAPTKKRRRAQKVSANHKKAKSLRNAAILAQAEVHSFESGSDTFLVSSDSASSSIAPAVAQQMPSTAVPPVSPVVAPQVPPVAAPQVPPIAAPQVPSSVAPQISPSIAPVVQPSVLPAAVSQVPPAATHQALPPATHQAPPVVAPPVPLSISPQVPPGVAPEVPTGVAPEVAPGVVPQAPSDVIPKDQPVVQPSVPPAAAPQVPPASTHQVLPATTHQVPPVTAPQVPLSTLPQVPSGVAPKVPPGVAPQVLPDVAPKVQPVVQPSVPPPVAPQIPPATTHQALPAATHQDPPVAAPQVPLSTSPQVLPGVQPVVSPSVLPTVVSPVPPAATLPPATHQVLPVAAPQVPLAAVPGAPLPRKRLNSSPAPSSGFVDLDDDDDDANAPPLGVTNGDLEEEERQEQQGLKRHQQALAIPSRKSGRVRKASQKVAGTESISLDASLPTTELVNNVLLDDSLPSYFTSAVQFMGSQVYGPHGDFLEMIKAFILFEAKSQFLAQNSRTKAVNRPKIIQKWMTGARRDFASMKSDDPARDVSGWFLWWATLQPAWRGALMPHSCEPPPGARYPDLKNGHMGVVTVVSSLVCLYWSTEDQELRQKLTLGARDVCWALTAAAQGMTTKNDEANDNQPPRNTRFYPVPSTFIRVLRSP
ncbi:hypothetical protein PUNSTDRAFT_47239 [Punctularia strigosozonata HHB-11173 SS5]|uniref:Uncharacterized protein n=1 Tax=Punctularia strigosozonata (strain HHB-11173) TaxID=741275 RepID=R7S523_PUNST|nr:uncharacterized protein PUNSTDRAFT_47239 [Punctularia strigosozonata HHB-11173 SS5]EIN05009.1 hypothetical protein PUNSTDRAFT_47239 [Punctularia strigosozonata HHB-11173 SS5]